MPVYNAERYVAQAVQSILNQTFRDFEFLIIDDGSTDRSLEILRKFEAKDQRIRLISRPNTGIVGALNDGLAVACAEFIARMDADDICNQHRLQKQYIFMKGKPNTVVCGTSWRTQGATNRVGSPCSVIYGHDSIETALLLGNGIAMLHPTVMMRRKAVLEVGGYRQHMHNMHEDLDLFLRLARVGELANLPDPLFIWRKHDQSNSALGSKHERSVATVRQILEEAHKARGSVLPENWESRPERWSKFQWHISSGWESLSGKRRSSALSHAFQSIRFGALRKEAWKLLACSLRGF